MSALVVSEPVRPRLPPEVARAVSRLAGRAHRFHRWAHHPLCAQYGGEVIAFGRRVRVCRGCAFVAVGLAVGAAAGIAFWTSWMLPVAGLAVLAASAKWRLPKWFGRFVPAVLVGAGAGAGLAGVALGAGSFVLALMAYRGRAPNRSACEACPQRTLTVCDGIKPIVRRERAVMRLSARMF